jgi:hypothetical protein
MGLEAATYEGIANDFYFVGLLQRMRLLRVIFVGFCVVLLGDWCGMCGAAASDSASKQVLGMLDG